jgi:hypothetical protein
MHRGPFFFGSDKQDIEEPLVPRQEEILDKIAAKVVQWKMAVPAIMFLESVKPLSYIGSQVMVFFEPFVHALFNLPEYNEFQQMMEKRENVERLLQRIEKFDAEAYEQEKKRKKEAKLMRKTGKRSFSLKKLLGKE